MKNHKKEIQLLQDRLDELQATIERLEAQDGEIRVNPPHKARGDFVPKTCTMSPEMLNAVYAMTNNGHESPTYASGSAYVRQAVAERLLKDGWNIADG